jgi:hypothetical protein
MPHTPLSADDKHAVGTLMPKALLTCVQAPVRWNWQACLTSALSPVRTSVGLLSIARGLDQSIGLFGVVREPQPVELFRIEAVWPFERNTASPASESILPGKLDVRNSSIGILVGRQ